VALALAKAGTIKTEGLVNVSDNLLTVLLFQDGELAQVFEHQRLGALAELPPPTRKRLRETLSSWLAHQRHVPTIAAALNVHPQTVRYRVAQLRELLGDTLDDPDGRLELELALHVSDLSPG
jgi:DNA-binding PucR family transcriptional regulator